MKDMLTAIAKGDARKLRKLIKGKTKVAGPEWHFPRL